MGFSWYTIINTNYYSPLNLFKNFIFPNLMRPTLSQTHTTSNIEDDEFRPSPSLVLLPVYLTARSIDMDRLPVVEYMTFRSHNNNCSSNNNNNEDKEEEEEGDDECTICLRRIEAWHNVRELSNCKHAFHVECLDSWIGRGGETCPVCRAQLVSGGGGEVGHGKDPWRSQRMVYLFGEDCFMEELY